MIWFLYQLAMQTKQIALGLYVADGTPLQYLGVRGTSSRWIPLRTADFVQDPHPRP